ncbi:glycogen synthase [bacterium BMS3Bbin08]|nr:glycogen synthase [bacterium BMS3Bbin08]
MNILIVTEYFPQTTVSGVTGGVESRSLHLGKELAKEHNVTILTSWQEGQKREDEIAGIKVIRCGSHHPYTNRGAVISRMKFALSALKAGRQLRGIDIVEGNTFITYLPAVYIAKHHGVPSIASYNEVWIGEWIRNKGLVTGMLGNIWERMVLSRGWTHFIAVSDFTAGKLRDRGISGKKITVVHNGIDLREIKNIRADKASKPAVCYIGRLTERKRVEDLLYAVSSAIQRVPELRCVIIGSGAEMNSLKRLAKKLGIEDHTDFTGYIENHDDVLKSLKSSHVLCLPSVVEGFGIVVIEAAACGVPFVLSDIDPLVEVSRKGKGGLIFKRRDVDDLAEKIVTLLTDRQLYDAKVKEAEDLADLYDWAGIAGKIKEIYSNLVETVPR